MEAETTGLTFGDVAGQAVARRHLIGLMQADRLPHALMLCGPQGAGKMALALALGRSLLCHCPTAEGEPCGTCPGCRMTAAWAHPDLHFSFPVIKKKSTDMPLSDDYITQWREMLSDGPYFTQAQWLSRLDGEKEQMQHFVGEADALQQKLSLRSSQGGRRVVVMWLPERMGEATANKLLKLIEEPPSQTHFLLVSDQPDQVLGTIQSRTQRLSIPPLAEGEIAETLVQKHGTEAAEAARIGHLAQGSMTRALALLQGEEGPDAEWLELFKQLMRTAYGRQIKQMRAWADTATALGRERQKSLLQYCQRMVRESFILNFRQPQRLNYLSVDEQVFLSRFAPFVHERNVIGITNLLADAERDIEQNVNARMVMTDVVMRLTVLLLTKGY